jgi:hypothetical protein
MKAKLVNTTHLNDDLENMVLQISLNIRLEHTYLVSERKQLEIPVIYFLYWMYSVKLA